MVELIHCAHCGGATKRFVTGTFDERVLKFCCLGCMRVFEFQREAGLPPVQQGGEGVSAVLQTAAGKH